MGSHRRAGAWMLAAFFFGLPAACAFAPETLPGPCQADPAVCDDGNPCTVDACDASSGYCTSTPDDSLVPDDGNPCTNDECADGAAKNTPVPDGTECGLSLACEGGKCKCTTASECGIDEACKKYACESQFCQTVFVSAGTVVDGGATEDCRQNACDGAGQLVTVPDPTDFPADDAAGDCKKKGCDAQGNVLDVDDPTDAPQDDANPCTLEACDGGTAIDHEPAPDGTACGAATSCGPNGSEYIETTAEECQAGTCLAAMAKSCGLYTCGAAGECNVSCATSADCVGGASCQGGLCKAQGGLGLPCSNNNECASSFCTDGVCCNVACNGTCQSCAITGQLGICGSLPAGTDPDNECTGPDACDGSGQCKKAIGESCTVASECLSGFCPNEGASQKVCCNTSCNGECESCLAAKTGGADGTCANIPAKTDPDDECPNGDCNTNTGNHCCDGTGQCHKD